MIQRIIYKAMTDGLTQIAQYPEILDDIFVGNYGLTQEETNEIKTFFSTKPPKVIHGYARTDQEPPFYSIILANEGEDMMVLGDDAGIIDDEDNEDYGMDMNTAFWAHNYQILCLVDHPEACQYIYEVAKAIILQAKPAMIAEGIYDIRVTGAELMPDPRYVPEHWFVRQITFSCKRELLTLNRESRLLKSWKIGGIHVDRSGSQSDVGKVKTLVKTY